MPREAGPRARPPSTTPWGWATPDAEPHGERPIRAVQVPTRGTPLAGDLVVPDRAAGVVLFAHGSGSSRRSPRNRQVAAALEAAGFGTLLVDLLSEQEERIDEITRELRFDIPMLAARLTDAADWLAGPDGTPGLPLATFGASTGAAAALITAAERPDRIRAVISRGGRPDLAGAALGRVRAPTLLIVGGADPHVLELNRAAGRQLAAEHDIAVVAGATHLFPEPGALEQVTALSIDWLARWLPATAR
jgi:dienelactone hydrolase